MLKVTNDDLEHKLDGIKAALGIQTTTTSSVLDNIKSDLDEIKGKLTEADRKFKKSLWVTLYVLGLALIVGGITGCASVFAGIHPESAQAALNSLFVVFIIGVAVIVYSVSKVCRLK